MDIQLVTARGIRFSVKRDGQEVGHAYLYVLCNDLHDVPFGLLEDVKVEESWRGHGVGNELLLAILDYARRERCYKLIATSRNDGSRDHVHEWYVRLGFKSYGTEFRLDLT